MKSKILTRILLCLALLFQTTGCNSPQELPSEEPHPLPPQLHVESNELVLDSEHQQFTIGFTIDNPVVGEEIGWRCNASWIEQATSSPNSLTFVVEENRGAERSTTLRLFYPGAPIVTVSILQTSFEEAKVPAIRVSKQSYTFSSAEEDISIDYSILNPIAGARLDAQSNADWVQIYGIDDQTISMIIQTNPGDERTTTLTLSYPEARSLALELTQAGTEDPNPDPDPTPTEGRVYRTGWPELCVEESSNPDYYYAHHITDRTMKGNKARNYTVCFSAKHHCPVWVAAPRHDAYEGSTNRTDAYAKDPQIPSEIQYHSKETGGGCNKGHMLGSAERTASNLTNKQAFYYTNIAPQYSSGYNTGGGGWNTLEDWVDKQVCADTTYLVIGTYFEKYTDGYGVSASPKTISFGGRNDVSCPTMFYIAILRTKRGNTGKSVIDCTQSELKCAAFVRTHSNEHKGQKVSSREMMSIADLEKLTGHQFFINVPNAPKESYTPSEWGL